MADVQSAFKLKKKKNTKLIYDTHNTDNLFTMYNL